MRTRNPQKLIMIVSLIMQLIMSCLVFQCGHGRTWLAVTEAPRIHALKRNFSSGGCAFSVESGTEPNKTVPDPVHGSSLAQSRGQGGRPTATHHHGIASALPWLLTATCRARNDMAATQRRYRR